MITAKASSQGLLLLICCQVSLKSMLKRSTRNINKATARANETRVGIENIRCATDAGTPCR